MKHTFTDEVKHVHDVNLPMADLEHLIDKVTGAAILVMGMYMVANTTSHILKGLVK